MVGMVVTCNNTGEGEDEEEVIKNPPTHFSTGSFHLDSLEYEIYIIKSEELSAVTSFISIFIELSDVIYQLNSSTLQNIGSFVTFFCQFSGPLSPFELTR